ncbi:MAG: hypothetical protein HYS25_13425 [Ignavibacteriales bacterium]|nr:hypothetical protein [Ignavibacteriales bacterium]
MIRYTKNILIHGVRTVAYNSKLVLLLWAFNALSALVLTVPILKILIDNLGNSLISDSLAHNFDYIWFLQFKKIYEVQFEQMPLSIYSVVGIYTLLQTFFLGGMISIFNIPEKNHVVDFFYGGVKYFFRFLKVLLISLFFFAAAFKINEYLGDLITYLFVNSENVYADFSLKAIRYVLLVFFIGVVTLFSDYIKVSLAVHDKTKVIKEFYSVGAFIKNNFMKIFTVFLIVAIIGALGAVIYNLIGRFIPRTPYYFLVISFILQQMLIIFRLFVRMLFSATEVNLYKDLSADIVSAEN